MLLLRMLLLPLLLSLPRRAHGITLRILSTCDIGAVLDVLVEIAYVAAYFLVRLEGEGDDGDEAECEPFPAFVDVARVVAAVLALDRQVFVAGEAGGECWREREG